MIFHNVTLGGAGRPDPSQDGFPRVGNGSLIFVGSAVFGPVDIGDEAIVGANAVVTRSVPPRAVVVGIPARVVRYRQAGRD